MRALLVGAGSAGCVVAAELAAAGYAVTVFEAGPGERALRSLDANWLNVQADPERSWSELRVRVAERGSPSPYLVGRGLGGGSAINGMLADLPPMRHKMWGPLKVKRSLRAVLDAIGPLETAVPDADGRRLLDGAQAHGWQAEPVKLTTRGGVRRDAAAAFLDSSPFLGLSSSASGGSINVLGNQRVEAVGPATATSPAWITVNQTRHEADLIVLSAGAIGSPTLLRSSGIFGPLVVDEDSLDEYPIDEDSLDRYRFVDYSTEEYSTGEYSLDETGHAASVGFGLSDHPSAAIQLPGEPSASLGDGPPITVQAERLCDTTRAGRRGRGRVTLMAATPSGPAQLLVALMNPRSEGRWEAGKPVFNQLSENTDRTDMANLFYDAEDLAGEVFGLKIKGADWFRGGGGYAHAAASCRIGVALDADGAVRDRDGRPLEGLHVIDASAFGAMPPVNPHIATMTLAHAMTHKLLAR